MHILRYPTPDGPIDWLTAGGTISAISESSADELAAGNAESDPVPMTGSVNASLVRGLRKRWARHRILDESDASTAWLLRAQSAEGAKSITGDTPLGQDHTGISSVIVEVPLHPDQIQDIAEATAALIAVPSPEENARETADELHRRTES